MLASVPLSKSRCQEWMTGSRLMASCSSYRPVIRGKTPKGGDLF